MPFIIRLLSAALIIYWTATSSITINNIALITLSIGLLLLPGK